MNHHPESKRPSTGSPTGPVEELRIGTPSGPAAKAGRSRPSLARQMTVTPNPSHHKKLLRHATVAVDGGKAPLALREPERSTSAIGDDESEDGILPLKLVKVCTYQFILQTFLFVFTTLPFLSKIIICSKVMSLDTMFCKVSMCCGCSRTFFLGALCVLTLESGICTFVQHFCSIGGEFIA